MKFSCVIPCYNAARWLPETLDSIAQQTYPIHEIVVVDDGSTDDSVAILETAQADGLPIQILKGGGLGPAGARNLAIENCTGDWVPFLDADDWWRPTHLQRIYDLVSPTDDVVYLAAAEHFSINVKRIVSRSDAPFQEPKSGMDHLKYWELYQQHGILELSSMAVKRDRLLEAGGFDPKMRGAEDLELMMRMIIDRTWSYDPIPSSVYRCNNPESHSRKGLTNADCLVANLRTLIKLEQPYRISPAELRGSARTVVSKMITDVAPSDRPWVKDLAWPYLSKKQKAIFKMAIAAPWAYASLNRLRQKLKGEQYRPRQVVPPAS
ncbi:MAG: glycosyltransferase family A protein [Cyanobacteria bacterium P01_D01_bin.73]